MPSYNDSTTLSASELYWEKIPFAHSYWRQFDLEAVPAGYHYAVAVWMTFFGVFGIVGNCVVIWIFCR